jgi:hypothetical protein
MASLTEDIEALYLKIKEEVRYKNPQFYERWKAGGFLIDEDIMCMYPCLSKVMGDHV